MDKIDDGSVSMTINFPGDVYYYLKKMAEVDRRTMKQEVLFLIEQAAKNMGIALDTENQNVYKHFKYLTEISAAENVPIIPENQLDPNLQKKGKKPSKGSKENREKTEKEELSNSREET